ncbi:MAG TPA: hypothetical protein VF553_21900 [Pyrinomonadaceae bacterium]|jgi:hypothetical protein
MEITGRELSLGECECWKELGEVLAAELKIVAARTTFSSVPLFLAEHMRRRLWKVDKRQARAEGRELPDEAMKTTPSVDASKCPECAGSGRHYPEGMEKGVKKWQQEKLIMSQESNESATQNLRFTWIHGMPSRSQRREFTLGRSFEQLARARSNNLFNPTGNSAAFIDNLSVSQMPSRRVNAGVRLLPGDLAEMG